MVIKAFPSIEEADNNGLLAVGGDTDVESLLLAYRSGIFPWPVYDDLLTWFAPPQRALLFVDEVHCSKSLTQFLKKNPYFIRINHAFPAVLEKCQEPTNRGSQGGTWITDTIAEGYLKLHEAGSAYSIESYLDDELVGGLYGVSIGAMVAGESMFYRKTNASKVCLLYLLSLLKESQIPWIDCQMETDNLKSFGAREVPREEFSILLEKQILGTKNILQTTKNIGIWKGFSLDEKNL